MSGIGRRPRSWIALAAMAASLAVGLAWWLFVGRDLTVLDPQPAGPRAEPSVLVGSVPALPSDPQPAPDPAKSPPEPLRVESTGTTLTVRWDEAPSEALRTHLSLELVLGEARRVSAGAQHVWTGDTGGAQQVDWTLRLDSMVLGMGSMALARGENELVLARGRWPSLTLGVRDPAGQPIGDASVSLSMAVEGTSADVAARADHAGKAHFAPLPPQCVFGALVQAPGFVEGRASSIMFSPLVHERTEVVVLAPQVELSGTILDAQGHAVTECDVQLLNHGRTLEAKSDLHGHFAFPRAAAGAAVVTTRCKTQPDVMEGCEIGPNGSHIVLHLPRASFVEGSVIDSKGQPVVGEPLHAVAGADGLAGKDFATRTAETDGAGQFRLGPFADGRVVIRAFRFGVQATARPGEPCLIQLSERSYDEVRLVLKDAQTGRPLSGDAEVSVTSGSITSVAGRRSIKADGAVTVTAMRTTGEQSVVAIGKHGYAPREVELPVVLDGAPIEVALERSGSLLLRCAARDGAPLGGVVLELAWPAAERPTGVQPQDLGTRAATREGDVPHAILQVASGDDGTVATFVVPPSSTTFVASKHGYYPSKGTVFDERGTAATIMLAPIAME